MSVDTQRTDPDAAPADNGTSPPVATPPADITTARELAARFRMPLVDLAVVGINPEATKEIPLKVLERVGAIPFAFEDDVLSIAITDPENVHSIDELRLATRYAVQFAIAPEEDVLARDPPALARERGVQLACSTTTSSPWTSPPTTSRPRTGSPTGRWCASSTRSSSRPPRKAPATCTSSRRRTR